MKTINVTYIGHSTNAKLKPSNTALLAASQSAFSEEVNITNAFLYESDPAFIHALLKQLLLNDQRDQLIITDEINCSLIQLLDQVYSDIKPEKFQNKYSLVQILDGELKSFNETISVYDQQIHYINAYNQKGTTFVKILKA